MGSSLHFILPILAILLGFFGLVLNDRPQRQVLAWLLFQTGWLIAFFQLEPRGGAMTLSSGGIFAVVTLGIFAVLWVLGRQAPASTESPKAASRKGSK